MAIRVRAGKSPVYHLQAHGHRYWFTRCGRRWHTPAHNDEYCCSVERVDHMREILGGEAKDLALCKQCSRDWFGTYWIEIIKRENQ